MPAYWTMTLEFSRDDAGGLVGRVYDAFHAAEAQFLSVFAWGCSPDMSLADVVAWNQAKLSKGFTLRPSQDVAHDYRQVMLRMPPYSYLRLFISLSSATGLRFNLIIPETEVRDKRWTHLYGLAMTLWSSAQPRSIQTYGEGAACTSHESLRSGAPPAANPFALLDPQYPRASQLHRRVELLSRGWSIAPSDPGSSQALH